MIWSDQDGDRLLHLQELFRVGICELSLLFPVDVLYHSNILDELAASIIRNSALPLVPNSP
jgi:hypothetical protein